MWRQCQPPPPQPFISCTSLRQASLALRLWWSLSLGGSTDSGHMGGTEQVKHLKKWSIQTLSDICATPTLPHTPPFTLAHRLFRICAASPLSWPGQGQWPCHVTQGKGCICWEGGYKRRGGRVAGWAADGEPQGLRWCGRWCACVRLEGGK